MFKHGSAFLFVVLLLASVASYAQVAGSLSGSVVDQNGAVIPNASVKVYLAGGKEPLLSGKTNESGRFVFTAVNPDTYDVGVEASGFGMVTYRLARVSPGRESALPPIKLDVQGVAQVVEVVAGIEAIQSANAEVSTTITNIQIQNLPVLGRQITTLFQTQPGVMVTGGPPL